MYFYFEEIKNKEFMLWVRNSETHHWRRSFTVTAFHSINALACLGQSRLTFRIILAFTLASPSLSEISHFVINYIGQLSHWSLIFYPFLSSNFHRVGANMCPNSQKCILERPSTESSSMVSLFRYQWGMGKLNH